MTARFRASRQLDPQHGNETENTDAPKALGGRVSYVTATCASPGCDERRDVLCLD